VSDSSPTLGAGASPLYRLWTILRRTERSQTRLASPDGAEERRTARPTVVGSHRLLRRYAAESDGFAAAARRSGATSCLCQSRNGARDA